jgi:hypothetical protein
MNAQNFILTQAIGFFFSEALPMASYAIIAYDFSNEKLK